MLGNIFKNCFGSKQNKTLNEVTSSLENMAKQSDTLEETQQVLQLTKELSEKDYLVTNDHLAVLNQQIDLQKKEIQKLETVIHETNDFLKTEKQVLKGEQTLWLKMENDIQDMKTEIS